MIHVSRTPEFSNCGNMNSIPMCTSFDQDLGSTAGSRSRQRSHSYYSPEDSKNYGVQTQTEDTNLRPRSRYVFTFNLKTCAVFFIQVMLVIRQQGATGMSTFIYVDLCLMLWKNWTTDRPCPTQKRLKRSIITKYIINTESTGPQVLLQL